MRIRLLLLTALMLHIAARGQTGYTYDYWFDNDRSTLQSGSSSSGSWLLQADVNSLTAAIHAFHLQVRDAEGNHSSSVTRYFVKTVTQQESAGRYWFDNDIANMHQATQVQGVFDINVSDVGEGFHTLHYQVISDKGVVTNTVSRNFFKTFVSANSRWRCWFDNDYTTLQTGNDIGSTLLLDVTDLKDGYHVLHVQVDGAAGAASKAITKTFIKIPQTEGTDYLTCLCHVDDHLYKQERITSHNGVVEWNFDVSSLPQGFHRVFIQVVTASGAASGAYQAFFLRETTRSEFAEMKCVYAIDGAEFYTEAGQVTDGTYHFDLDVSALDDGLHRLTYMLSNGKGVETKTQTQFFMKTPLGGNGITEYWYWLNEQDEQQAHKVTLPERQNPFSLITLLPVESQPIRSSLFEFRVEQGQPAIYAKNDIHIRFYDAAGRFTDANKQYVDESVRQEVTDAEWLESGVTTTTDKPVENAIKWYKVEAEKGDSLQFKLNRAATIELFSPSGNELYSASGAESTNWGGCHAEENGTFYVALHDVSAQQGTTVSIDYEHIDKFAVLRQDVTAVGNRGECTITFYGNGFDELTDVFLVQQSDTIRAVETNIATKAVTSITFNFDDAPLGQYKAIFIFTEGTVEVSNSVTVEEATDFDIDVAATFGKNNLLSFHKTKYIFSVRNNSNVTAYDVPLMIRVYTHDANSLQRVDIEGYDLKEHFRKYLGENYTDSLDNAINQKMKVSGHRCFFIESDSTDIVAGWAAHLHETFVCPTIPPYSTKDIVVSLELGQSVYCYMWHPETWDDAAASRANSRMLVGNGSGCSESNFLQRLDCFLKKITKPQGHGGDGYLGARRRVGGDDCNSYSSPPICPGDGGGSAGAGSNDPNDITGYTSESGSKFIKGDVLDLDYAIEFENDTTFATASAHTIVVKDTLNSQYFDLSSYRPTSIRIGSKAVDLDGNQDFVKTIDMRPEIYAVALVEGTFDTGTGVATWMFTSLDPMTMEPTEDFMSGILPVNYNGTSGIGKVFFDVDLKGQFEQGTEIPNRAGIVFDMNETIVTPTWTNIVDRIAPTSCVTNVVMTTDSTAAVHIDAADELSGPWRYSVYVQYGSGAWFVAAENVAVDSVATVKLYEGIEHHFYCVATDMAGNVEKKEARSEVSFYYGDRKKGDVNGDGKVSNADLSAVIYAIAGTGTETARTYADVNGDGIVNVADIVEIIGIIAAKSAP